MIERTLSLRLKPGVYRNGTRYQAKNRWYDANGVRWYEGIMGPIGGWREVIDAAEAPLAVTGKPRAAYGWRANDGLSHMGIGTHSKLWLYTDATLEDVTPAGFPATVDDFVDGAFVAGNFGSGNYGEGYYGTGSGALTLVAPSTWTLDNFGELLVACHTLDGRLLMVDPGGGDAVEVDATAPVANTAVVVTPEHFIVALGADGNSRRVKWPDQESLSDWEITTENQANEFDLPTKGRLVCGRRTRRQTILWTDVDVFAMSYNGGIDVYGFEQLGDNCGIIGPQACAVLGDRMFWMSYGKFFEYDGALKPIACDVLDEVFGSLDQSQRAKIQAIPMTLFNEVWWTYPVKSGTSYECTRFVGYNYQENHWIMGELPRAAGIDRGVYEYPVLIDPDGQMWEHEIGALRTDMNVFAETGPIELGDGDQLIRVQQYIPDEKTLGDVTVTLFGANHPTATEKQVGPFTASEPTPTRLTARQIRFRVDEVTATDWRVGVPKLGVIPAGNR